MTVFFLKCKGKNPIFFIADSYELGDLKNVKKIFFGFLSGHEKMISTPLPQSSPQIDPEANPPDFNAENGDPPTFT